MNDGGAAVAIVLVAALLVAKEKDLSMAIFPDGAGGRDDVATLAVVLLPTASLEFDGSGIVPEVGLGLFKGNPGMRNGEEIESNWMS